MEADAEAEAEEMDAPSSLRREAVRVVISVASVVNVLRLGEIWVVRLVRLEPC